MCREDGEGSLYRAIADLARWIQTFGCPASNHDVSKILYVMCFLPPMNELRLTLTQSSYAILVTNIGNPRSYVRQWAIWGSWYAATEAPSEAAHDIMVL